MSANQFRLLPVVQLSCKCCTKVAFGVFHSVGDVARRAIFCVHMLGYSSCSRKGIRFQFLS